jgi:hypothetical protein
LFVFVVPLIPETQVSSHSEMGFKVGRICNIKIPLDSLVERAHLANLVVSGKMDFEAVEWVELAEDAVIE